MIFLVCGVLCVLASIVFSLAWEEIGEQANGRRITWKPAICFIMGWAALVFASHWVVYVWRF